MAAMLLRDVVETSGVVAATRSRKAKVAAIAERLAEADVDELPVVTAYLGGTILQRRTGVGWRGLSSLPEPAVTPSVTVQEVDEALDRLAAMAGTGSQEVRASGVRDLFARMTADEQRWLRGVMTGNVRQGALDALVQEAVVAASGVPLTAVRRAAMLAGGTVPIVVAAMTGGEEALARVGLEVGRPVLPMLASTAPDVAAAMAKAGGGPGTPVAVDEKLDGIRIQVHKHGDDILVATRSLDDITPRLPEVVDVVRSLPAHTLVLDGEAIALDATGRPRPFQETASRTAQAFSEAAGVAVTPYFFDVLHVDGRDQLDTPGADRLQVLDAIVPEAHRVARVVTDDPAVAEAFAHDAVSRGHEGVVVKSLAIGYAAGRRGSGWVKVKPVHTLDLVVLAVEWGSGRREGWLSNIHLGARDPAANGGAGGFVMLGKTFKGMTDQMLAWQTERFTELALEPEHIHDSYVVPLRPEQVVEIAFDGVQRSSRYPGGLALRFARVVRYRDDKPPDEADEIRALQALLPAAPQE
jgi:DNA ligase 1